MNFWLFFPYLLYASLVILHPRVQKAQDPQTTSQWEWEGKVEDERGIAVENALVLARSAKGWGLKPPLTARTDGDGRFVLQLPQDGPYSVMVSGSGFVLWIQERVGIREPLQIVLSRGKVLTGVVRDARSREPIPGAKVESSPPVRGFIPHRAEPRLGIVAAVTDDKGQFRLEGLPAGARTVWAAAPGYGRAEVRVSPAETSTDIFLFPGSGIVGTVRGPGGEPIADAHVVAQRRNERSYWDQSGLPQKTNNQGLFEVLGLEPGLYRLIIRHEDFAFRIVSGLEVKAEEDTAVDVYLTEGASVYGRIVNEEGDPLDGEVRLVTVDGEVPSWAVLRDQLMARARQDGQFELVHVPAGKHQLTLQPLGFGNQELEVYVGERSREVDLGDIGFETGLTIRGVIVDEKGEPMPEASVTASRERIVIAGDTAQWAQTKTKEDGSFQLSGLVPGTYRIHAFGEGYGRSEEKTVEAGSDEIVFVLEPSGSLTGQVVDAEGTPLSSFEVMVQPQQMRGGRSSSQSRPFSEVEDGRFSMNGLSQDNYLITVSAEGLKPTSMSKIEVWPGGLTDVGRIVLHPGGVIRGRVVDMSGDLIAGVTLTVNPGPRDGTVSDTDGYFEIRGFEDGVVDVRASHPDYAEKTLIDVEVRSAQGPVAVEIRLSSGGRLEGFVRDRNGSGIAGRVVASQALRTRGRESVTTEANGYFLFERLPAGLNRVQLLSGEGKLSVTLQDREITIRDGETSVVEFRSRQVQVFGYARKAGVPLSGAHITLHPTQSVSGFRVWRGDFRSAEGPLPLVALTGHDGFYELWVDQPGEYKVNVTATDRATRLPRKSVVIPDVDSHSLDLNFDSLSVRGLVVSKDREEPIARARVLAYLIDPAPVSQTFSSARTDVSGHFNLELEPGEYRFQIRAEDYAPKEMTLPVNEAASELLVVLSRGLRIHGRVVDAEGRHPGRYYVHVTEDGQPTTEPPRFSQWGDINPDGTFELLDLANQRYNILAGHDLLGFAFAPGVLPDPEGLRLRLRPAGWVELTVWGPDGAPVVGARVVLSGIEGRKARGVFGQTDERGIVKLFVPTGNIEIKAVKGGDLQGSVRVSASKELRAFAEIQLQPIVRH